MTEQTKHSDAESSTEDLQAQQARTGEDTQPFTPVAPNLAEPIDAEALSGAEK